MDDGQTYGQHSGVASRLKGLSFNHDIGLQFVRRFACSPCVHMAQGVNEYVNVRMHGVLQ